MPRRARPTLKDLAARLGISETAASFALNGRSGVSAQTRQRVLALAAELQWSPHHAARTLSGSASMTIGFALTRDVREFGTESFYLRLLAGTQAVLSRSGYGLLFHMTRSVAEELTVLRRWSDERRVDGVIISDLRRGDPRPALLRELGVPAVLAGGPDPKRLIPCVSVDDGVAIGLLVTHLLATGRRRLAYVSGPGDLLHVHRRVAAFRRAAGPARAPRDVLGTDYSDAQGRAATERLLGTGPPPDALIFDNEVLAVAGVRTLRTLGRSIPDDISVASVEDSPVCTALTPSLTAVHRDPVVFGESVARRLLHLVNGTPDEPPDLQRPTLTVRESTALP
ncbi:DNA-binding LacI/PurR family transcriptional regulator [Catenuloplanes nepalensis]|uniref:DNA-binding LacI/PurR family transcriptional regulator n=1 Tax=Catenuloplanes nepalensis TaxID=587533 RepID=A0ABT9MR79_9ACTN|nr:LacI family DNA-binding transcriptional regulator [Catenuloplanes nepalensis]MDP9793920.1 DNA-binding LacI/PurR family transcriptional regulator [Catenuloplanes nepalensis]